MKFKTIIATTDLDKQGDRFSLEAFKDAKTWKNIPILRNFDENLPIGQVIAFSVEDNNLVAEIEITDEEQIADMIYRPSGMVLESELKKDKQLINKFDMVSIGMISKKKDVYEQFYKYEK